MVNKRARKRALARQKWERQQARRLERRLKARRRAIVGAAVFGVLAVLGGSVGIWWLAREDSSASASPTSSPTPTTSPTGTSSPSPSPSASGSAEAAPQPTKAGECVYVREPGDDQLSLGLPKASFTPAESATATITTNQGTIRANLFPADAGCAVNSMKFLAGKDAFDQTRCGELAVAPSPTRYLGCGGLSKSGDRGPGYIFGNENAKTKVEPGLLVMAGPENRNGSRFFITYGKTATFDHPVTVFGRVTSGLSVVEKVAEDGLVGTKGGSDSPGVGRAKTELIVQDVKVTTT